MTSVSSPSKPTANVYVDGFNLYYGCFNDKRHRPHWRQYRWLDLSVFCGSLLPAFQINRIRYFSALVNPQPHNPECQMRQRIYLRALATIPHLTIHMGRFSTNAKDRVVAARGAARPTPLYPVRFAHVIEEEEKGSDVNLASYLLFDGFKRESSAAIVISNDSDLAEPIRLARTELGLHITLVSPRKFLATDLRHIANSTKFIRLKHVQDAQFPPTLQDDAGKITKPARWNEPR